LTGAGFEILVIEDNPADVHMVREAIKGAGLQAEICVVTDGEQATRFFDERDLDSSKPCPDAIILDINLPKKRGGEILRHIRRSVRCSATPVLIVSTSGSEKDRADVMKHGANGYFRKPSEYDEYLKLVRSSAACYPANRIRKQWSILLRRPYSGLRNWPSRRNRSASAFDEKLLNIR
jgi:two-component system, chemotaxis family, response regulator Rcp1